LTAKCNTVAKTAGGKTGGTAATIHDGLNVVDALNTLWEPVTLNHWRGTVAGCIANGVVTAGACTGTLLNTGKNV